VSVGSHSSRDLELQSEGRGAHDSGSSKKPRPGGTTHLPLSVDQDSTPFPNADDRMPGPNDSLRGAEKLDLLRWGPGSFVNLLREPLLDLL
jgi:hypothetical protein